MGRFRYTRKKGTKNVAKAEVTALCSSKGSSTINPAPQNLDRQGLEPEIPPSRECSDSEPESRESEEEQNVYR